MRKFQILDESVEEKALLKGVVLVKWELKILQAILKGVVLVKWELRPRGR